MFKLKFNVTFDYISNVTNKTTFARVKCLKLEDMIYWMKQLLSENIFCKPSSKSRNI